MSDHPAGTAVTTVTNVTPFEAKIAWETLGRPTNEKLIAHFAAEGKTIAKATLSYWKNHQWKKDFSDEVADLVLSIGLNSTMNPKELDAKLNGLLRIMTDPKMLRTTYRAVMAATIKTSLAIARNSNAMAKTDPQKMGNAIKSSAEAITKAIEGMKRMELVDQKVTQHSGITIEGQAVETSPEDSGPDFSDEIAAFSREAQRLQ